MPSLKPFPIAVSLLLVAIAAPAAQAGHEEGSLIKCDDDPLTVVQYVLDNAVGIATHVLQTYLILAGKTKCTTLETIGVCSDESVPLTSSNTKLLGIVPLSTGSYHPHRGSCYEYFFTGFPPGCGALVPTKIHHWYDPQGADHHDCVGLNHGFP